MRFIYYIFLLVLVRSCYAEHKRLLIMGTFSEMHSSRKPPASPLLPNRQSKSESKQRHLPRQGHVDLRTQNLLLEDPETRTRAQQKRKSHCRWGVFRGELGDNRSSNFRAKTDTQTQDGEDNESLMG